MLLLSEGQVTHASLIAQYNSGQCLPSNTRQTRLICEKGCRELSVFRMVYCWLPERRSRKAENIIVGRSWVQILMMPQPSVDGIPRCCLGGKDRISLPAIYQSDTRHHGNLWGHVRLHCDVARGTVWKNVLDSWVSGEAYPNHLPVGSCCAMESMAGIWQMTKFQESHIVL